jgi:hypothetical protein
MSALHCERPPSGIRVHRFEDAVPVALKILQVKVKPAARASSLTLAEDGTWLAQIKSPPVDGKANAELVGLVARHFGCPRSAVRLKVGSSGRLKLLEVSGV